MDVNEVLDFKSVDMINFVGRYSTDLLPNVVRQTDKCLMIPCINPSHLDRTPSCAIYRNGFYCFGCNEGGSLIKYVSLKMRKTRADAIVWLTGKIDSSLLLQAQDIVIEQKQPIKPLPKKMAIDYYNNINDDVMDYYVNNRGFTPQTVEQYLLGYGPIAFRHKSTRVLDFDHNHNCYTIPVFYNEILWNIKMRKTDDSIGARYLNISDQGSQLYLGDQLEKAPYVIIAEGEYKAIILRQYGFHAVASTAGCQSWNKDYNNIIGGVPVYLLMDNDDAGKKARNKFTGLIGRPVIHMTLPIGKGDAIDFFKYFPNKMEAVYTMKEIMRTSWERFIYQQSKMIGDMDAE